MYLWFTRTRGKRDGMDLSVTRGWCSISVRQGLKCKCSVDTLPHTVIETMTWKLCRTERGQEECQVCRDCSHERTHIRHF